MGEVVQSVIFKKLFWLLEKISVEIFFWEKTASASLRPPVAYVSQTS